MTILGETFAGRVAASLLHAIGLPELVTHSLAEYEALTLRLANEPALLAEIRRKLNANRLTHPLFDANRYTRHLEAAFTRMWEIWAGGGRPEAFAVAPIAAPAVADMAEVRNLRRLYAACPLCGSADHAPWIGADCTKHPAYRPTLPPVTTWHRCGACEHIFTEGFFDAAVAAKIFAPARQEMLGHEMEDGRRAAGAAVARVARHVVPPAGAADLDAAWLDVGFGNGALVFTAAEWGFRAVGVDPREANVAGLRQLGFEAHCGTIEDIAGEGRFAVISFADHFQRLAYPGQTLAAARRLLREDGVLMLSLPNKDTMLFNLLHANQENPYWREIGDCQMFGRTRLHRLLREHGFAPIEYNISEHHRIGMEVIARRIG